MIRFLLVYLAVSSMTALLMGAYFKWTAGSQKSEVTTEPD